MLFNFQYGIKYCLDGHCIPTGRSQEWFGSCRGTDPSGRSLTFRPCFNGGFKLCFQHPEKSKSTAGDIELDVQRYSRVRICVCNFHNAKSTSILGLIKFRHDHHKISFIWLYFWWKEPCADELNQSELWYIPILCPQFLLLILWHITHFSMDMSIFFSLSSAV